MHFEERMPKMGVDCDTLPNGLPLSPKHPLSKSLRRSASNRAIHVRERGPEPTSLLNQAILKNSRAQSLEYHRPQQPSSPKTLFSLQTTPPAKSVLPPKPTANSKHFSRSLTFSSIERQSERRPHRETKLNSSTSADHLANLSVPRSEPTVPIPSLQDSEADGPSIFSKSLFRSSSFSGLRGPKMEQNTSNSAEDGPRRLSTGSPPPAAFKSFMRSSSFIHPEQEVPVSRSFSRSSSAREPAQEQKEDIISSFSKWARSFRSKPAVDPVIEIPESSPYSLLSKPAPEKRTSPRVSPIVEIENSFGVLTKGFLDSSRNAVKAVQDKAQHLLNKRYQDGGFHLDMVYITENIIALGFPDTYNSSNILGFKESNYRDNIEELIGFCETQHPDKYKIFNLCSEKLYDTSLLHDKVACFPFQGNNCPPLQLVSAFCETAYSWLKAGLENVIVVHCKGGMARTGLMISCLLLHLKFFPTAEEAVNHYNQKRCVDSNGLVLPSHLRYVKYYEQVLRKHQGFTPTGRRCTLRSIRLINCPSWIRPAVTISDHEGVLFTSKKHPKTRSMLAEDVWLSAIKSGVFLFELPDDGHAAAVDGDFKIHFQDRNVDFSCWLNTNMMEGNIILRVTDLDGYEKNLEEAMGFQVELELLDTYLSVLKVTKTGDSAPSSIRPSLPSDMAFGRTSSCIDTATDGETTSLTDSDAEKEESPAVSARPSTEKRDMRESEAAATTSQTPFQIALSNAVTEVSTGILNAMDRLGMNHLRTHSRSASVPSSPRISSDRHHYGSARSADFEKDSWSTGSSRFQSSKEVLQKQFTYDFEASEPAGSMVDSSVCNRELSGLSLECENSGASFRSDDPGSSFRSEDDTFSDVPSDFQALAAASAADASLFTFGDEEDYDSDEM
ncbi:hypothetical protein M758_8G115300 [Ceratodon purpureus]|uniref:Phosphatidylinositol-3,4,5-trisphosphate 3-phosphatase n=1 Tax=Ceratodon purpureus TaxID=3225 RepID=A0A8T0GZP7_CERPU|nr:hypothetical protein KC19_8G118900 [Ceratodon purpureus]KAG0608564.1 hypothetical protein M758_8G115300 [Ceratodon purpureus]